MAVTKTTTTITNDGITDTITRLRNPIDDSGFHFQRSEHFSGISMTDGTEVNGSFFFNIEQNGGGFHSASHASESDIYSDGSSFKVIGSNAGNDTHLDSHLVITQTAPDGTVSRFIATESEFRPGLEDRPHNLMFITVSSDGDHDVTHIHTGPGDGWLI
jgi:hypothetical protein